MSKSRGRAVRAALLLVMLLALPGAVGAGTRIPVNSTDDVTSPTANRIAAVTNIVNATNARFARVQAAYPPNPCLDATEPLSVCLAAVGVLGEYMDLGVSVADACAAPRLGGPGDAIISDADAFATDMSATGIANQLASITIVLDNANDRLTGISTPDPGPAEIAALTELGEAVALGQGAVADFLGGTGFPPNPCVPDPVMPD